MNATLRAALAVVCIVVITVCAILLFGRAVGRARVADLTEHRLYTLSDGTRNILGKLNQTITLKLYYSRVAARKGPEQIRFWNNYYLYVRDLLDEFADRSGGKLRLEAIDPRPFSDEEEDAIRYGVRRFQLSADETFFFGLVASTELGKDETIKFFEPDRQEFVEYDVAKLIAALMQPEKRKIGVIANVPIMGSDMSPYMMQMLRMQGRQPEQPWTIVSHIKQRYEMEKIDLKGEGEGEGDGAGAAIPDDIDFLMVVHPKELDENTRFAIDQYVMKGGKVIVFVDPHCLQDRPASPKPQMQMQHKAASDLNGLLEKWGVRMEPGKIAIDRTLGMRVALRPNTAPERFPAYIELGDEQASDDEVITADLHTVRMLYPGSLTRVDGAGTDVRALLTTTSVGNTWKPSGPFELQFPDAAAIRKAVPDGTQPLMLACLITGKFKTNFPDGIEVESGDVEEEKEPGQEEEEKGKKGEDGEEKEPAKKMKRLASVTEAADGATVVVVADVDMLTDMLAYEGSFFGMALSGDNASFVFNALDYLSGSEDLIRIRSRGRYSRPFTVVDDIEKAADEATAEEVKAINGKIKMYEDDLKQLGGRMDDENVELIQSAAMEKRRKIETQIRQANKQLRKLRARRREQVEALGWKVRVYNIAIAPGLILVIAVVLAIVRGVRARKYAARRG